MKLKPFSFELELIPWECYLLVVVGGGMKDIKEAITKRKFVPELIDIVKKDPPQKDSDAYIWESENARELVIWFEDVQFEKKGKKRVLAEYFLRLVAHEVDHVYYTVARICGFVDEAEANAYSRAWLYGRIKEKISEALKESARKKGRKSA